MRHERTKQVVLKQCKHDRGDLYIRNLVTTVNVFICYYIGNEAQHVACMQLLPPASSTRRAKSVVLDAMDESTLSAAACTGELSCDTEWTMLSSTPQETMDWASRGSAEATLPKHSNAPAWMPAHGAMEIRLLLRQAWAMHTTAACRSSEDAMVMVACGHDARASHLAGCQLPRGSKALPVHPAS